MLDSADQIVAEVTDGASGERECRDITWLPREFHLEQRERVSGRPFAPLRRPGAGHGTEGRQRRGGRGRKDIVSRCRVYRMSAVKKYAPGQVQQALEQAGTVSGVWDLDTVEVLHHATASVSEVGVPQAWSKMTEYFHARRAATANRTQPARNAVPPTGVMAPNQPSPAALSR